MADDLITQTLHPLLTEAQEVEVGLLVQFLSTCNAEIGDYVEHPLSSCDVFSQAHRVLKVLGLYWYYGGQTGEHGTFVRRSS